MPSENTNVDISLHQAAYKGHKEIVKALLAKGADVNAKDNNGKTALYQAAQNGHKEVVKDLLAAGADANAADNQGKTPLYWAAYKGHKEIVKDLLAAGADFNAADQNGITALYWAAQKGHKEIVKDLLAAGAVANAADQNGANALRQAAYKGYTDITKALLAAGADANAADQDGLTALYWAAQGGHKEIVKALLNMEGIKVNAANNRGVTPLHWATQKCYKDIILLLLAAGANPLLEDRYDRSPKDLAESGEIRKIFEGASELPKMKKEIIGASGMSLLDLVLMNPADEANVIRCAHNPKLSKEGTYEDRYYIFAAIIDARFEAIEKRRYLENEASNAMIRMCKLNGRKLSKDASKILAANIPSIRLKRLIVANVNVKDEGKGGKTLLHLAAEENQIDEVNALLTKGAYVNIRDDYGHAPLHLSARNGHIGVVELLLKQKGADVHAADKNGRTALEKATSCGHKDVVTLLLAAGAEVGQPSHKLNETQEKQHISGRKK